MKAIWFRENQLTLWRDMPPPSSGSKVNKARQQQTVPIVRFEVFTAVTMKKGVFWDVTPCGSCKNRSFGGT
jgi:hypothetical protein